MGRRLSLIEVTITGDGARRPPLSGGDPHCQAAPVARLTTFATNNARPTPAHHAVDRGDHTGPTDRLHLPQQHQVLQGIAQQGREAHAEPHDMMFSFNVARQ
jgi:hypothetical protein